MEAPGQGAGKNQGGERFGDTWFRTLPSPGDGGSRAGHGLVPGTGSGLPHFVYDHSG